MFGLFKEKEVKELPDAHIMLSKIIVNAMAEVGSDEIEAVNVPVETYHELLMHGWLSGNEKKNFIGYRIFPIPRNDILVWFKNKQLYSPTEQTYMDLFGVWSK